jgi:hypothetical protein
LIDTQSDLQLQKQQQPKPLRIIHRNPDSSRAAQISPAIKFSTKDISAATRVTIWELIASAGTEGHVLTKLFFMDKQDLIGVAGVYSTKLKHISSSDECPPLIATLTSFVLSTIGNQAVARQNLLLCNRRIRVRLKVKVVL